MTDPQRIIEWYERRTGEKASLEETHISLVILGERHVYKFKKPVRFSFLDYSTPRKRFLAAVEEIRTNARLTEGVYLGLCLFDAGMRELPSLLGAGIYAPEDRPEIAEVAVVMRRLPDERHMDRLIEREDFDAAYAIDTIARRLADFHDANRLDEDPGEHAAAVAAQSADNFDTLARDSLLSLIPASSRRALDISVDYGRAYLAASSGEIRARARDGCVVEGHGDLRLEHVCMEQSPGGERVQIYDCVEFDRGLRVLDVASDVGFLAMDLDLRGRSDLSALLCERYAACSRGRPLEPVIRFYKIYRSLVRAKVNALGAEAAGAERRSLLLRRLEDHIALSARYALGLDGAVIFVLSGLMGVGKTSLARALSAFVHPSLYSADVIRREILGKETTGGRGKQLGFGAGAYSTERKALVYSEMRERASRDLERGRPVILDASFMYRWQREVARELADRHGCPAIMVECKLEPRLTLERLAARAASSPDDPSDGRIDLYEQQRKQWEAISAEEGFALVEADMAEDVTALAERIARTAIDPRGLSSSHSS